jgi:ATP-binding cassette subfamily B protein/subfamily B ATP-binding cassette protein MsbA
MSSLVTKLGLDSLVRLRDYPARRWRGLLLIFVVTLLSTGLSLLQPLPLKLLADHAVTSNPLPISITLTSAQLVAAAAALGLIVFALQSISTVALTFLWVQIGQRMIYELMAELFAHVQRLSLRFHHQNEIGDVMGRITTDAWAIYTVTDSLLFRPVSAIALAIGMAIVMVQISIPLTIISFTAAPLMAVGSVVLARRLRQVAHVKRQAETKVQAHVQQTLSGLAVTQAFGQEERVADRFRDVARGAIDAYRKTTVTGGIYNLFSGGLNSIGAGVVLYAGALYTFSGQLTTGDLLIFIAYLTSLQTQLKLLIQSYGTLQDSGASLDRVAELLDEKGEVSNIGEARSFKGLPAKITFENVAFSYGGERTAVTGVSFTAASGETIALVGPTGSGKSTIASLVPRFYDPQSGHVLINGVDVRSIDLRELRANVAMVLQEPFLFPFSIAENIGLGNPRASREQIIEAARAAKAHDFIERQPRGYETIIGERGSTLSGGERQRIAIARAFLKDAPILILDEPTSSLDNETEAAILDTLDELSSGRTTIVIAHRLSTIRRADQIIVVENGAIEQRGSHSELLAAGGLYARLYSLQARAVASG